MRSKFILVYLVCWNLSGLALGFVSFAPYEKEDYRKQLTSGILNLPFGMSEEGDQLYYKVQPSLGEYLYLGPNEVFFSDSRSLSLGGGVANKKMSLNKGVEFSTIQNFKEKNAKLEWGLILQEGKDLRADFFINASSSDVGRIFSVQIDDGESIEVEITQDIISSGRFSVDLFQVSEGFHIFRVTAVSAYKSDFQVLNVRLIALGSQGSEAPINSYVVRERWRPSAAYSSWSSSSAHAVKAWIMELTSESEGGHFSPITTNFGYYGPIFKPDNKALEMNMSFWGDQEGPVNKQSHLLGIGSSQGVFGRWSHEGTGVKVRDWKNFDSNTSGTYTIGMRYSDDGLFRTFYGYFWNEGTEEWQLYSIGRVLIKSKLTSLKTKAFIEVVGGAEQERSGQKIRKINYRGWVRNSQGIWSELDQLHLSKDSEFVNKNSGITPDGERFFTSTGGFVNRAPYIESHVLTKGASRQPVYMESDKLEKFDQVPYVPVVDEASLSLDNVLTVRFKVKTEETSNVTLYWGEEDGLSNEVNYPHKTSFVVPAGDKDALHTIEIPNVENARFLRMLVKDSRAQMWTFDTTFVHFDDGSFE
jgi:hypothetical protein